MDSRLMRRNFASGLLAGLRVVWPILSFLIGLMIALGLVVGLREGWSIQESIYFAFVSGLTIGLATLPRRRCWRARSQSSSGYAACCSPHCWPRSP